MYAIVEIAGQQFKVQKDQQVYVHRLEGNAGDKVQFDNVLLIDNNGKVAVGAPAIQGAAVKATINEHLKGDKVIVFKKKRRKGYRKKNGHRQYLTSITIEEIIEKGAKASAPAAKKAAPKKEEPKAEAKAAPKAKAEKPVEAKTEAPKAEPKKEETPKAEAPKAEAKKEETPKVEAAPEAPKTEEAPKADDSAADAEGDASKS